MKTTNTTPQHNYKETLKVKALISDLTPDLYDFYFNDYIENFDIIIYNYYTKDFKNYNHDIIENIIESLKNYDDFKNDFENMDQFVKYYHIEKENGKKWSNQEINTYKKVYESFNNSEHRYYYYTNDDILKLLNIIKCKKYNYTNLLGYSQGEKTTLFYNPNEIKESDIKLIESLYFGGCKEIIFTHENIRKIEKIYNCEYGSILSPSFYDIDDIKKGIENYYNNKNYKINVSFYEAIEKQVIKTEYKKI